MNLSASCEDVTPAWPPARSTSYVSAAAVALPLPGAATATAAADAADAAPVLARFLRKGLAAAAAAAAAPAASFCAALLRRWRPPPVPPPLLSTSPFKTQHECGKGAKQRANQERQRGTEKMGEI